MHMYNLAALYVHLAHFHKGAKPLKCPLEECKESFDRYYELARHKWQHIPDKYRPRCQGLMQNGKRCDYA